MTPNALGFGDAHLAAERNPGNTAYARFPCTLRIKMLQQMQTPHDSIEDKKDGAETSKLDAIS
jgi:hypothetical protein